MYKHFIDEIFFDGKMLKGVNWNFSSSPNYLVIKMNPKIALQNIIEKQLINIRSKWNEIPIKLCTHFA